MANPDKRGDGNSAGQPVRIEDLRMLKKARSDEWVAERLRWAEICNRRAQVRQSMRGLIERSKLLADLFGVRYSPPVTANQINMEEEERKLVSVKKMARDEKDAWPGETLEFIAHPEIHADEATIRQSEYAKHLGERFAALMAKCEFKEARALMEKMRRKAKNPKAREYMEKELIFRMARFYAECIAERDTGAMIEAYMEIGAAVKVGREDLAEIKDAQLDDEETAGRLGRQISGFKVSSPDLYDRMKVYFEEMGLKVRVK